MIEVIKSGETRRLKAKLARIKERNVALDAELMNMVASIVEDVGERGDAALLEYTERFDGVRLEREALRASEDELRASAARVDGEVLEALREAIRRIRAFHEHERVQTWFAETRGGVRLGQRVTPVEAAGLYVPGGTASYPSSVVMNVVPAQVAGVGRIAVVTPPRTLAENPAVAAALVELGVKEIYKVGGAQSVAALAYGTESVPRVDKITGPGNKYVAAAKKLVFGVVGIDSIAGPSEVVVLADETARAAYVAADLLAQAEHGEDASAILITRSERLAREVAEEVERQASELPRRALIAASLERYGAVIVVETTEEACALVNELAPEHLEIVAADEEALAERVQHAGAIFFGSYTPEAVGDYFAGPNHVLPTGGSARFSSALGVGDFLRRTSLLRYDAEELARTARMIAALARAEGLDAHARSALIRADEATRDEARETAVRDETLDDGKLGETKEGRTRAAEGASLAVEAASPVEAEPSVGVTPPVGVTPTVEAARQATTSCPPPLSVVKPRVRELRAYTLSPDKGRIKINQNENPWDAPARIKRETLRRLEGREWSRYPEFVPAALHEKLARFGGWTPDGIVAGNGSNELIQALLMVTVAEGRRVLIAEPTFALYRQVTTVLGGDVFSVPLDARLNFDTPALVEAIKLHDPEVTIICSPNNPTGCVIEERDLSSLLDAARGLVVVDEAYWEFSGSTVARLLGERKNLAVFRTFSKAMAMAALRVGYLMAAPELAREVSKAVLPYNLNAFSLTAAEVAIDLYEEELQPLVARILAERERLYTELRTIEGLEAFDSHANFIVVRSRIEPRRVFDELLKRQILIRDVSGYPMLKDFFRMSVGTPEENDALLAALREIFAAR